MAGQPKPAFYIVLVLVVLGLIGFGIYQMDILAPEGEIGKPPEEVDPDQLGMGGGGDNGESAEAMDTLGITTVKEYTFKPSEKLPPLPETGAYKAMEDNTVRFALNVWAGWAPIILANEGFRAGKVWKTPDGEEFKVELVLIDNPVEMSEAYAAGEVHIGWATLDMVPLFMERFVNQDGRPKDPRIMPRIFQQVDWSNGGDGIVARNDIKTVADLRGKTIVLAENSPSHYFALNMLVRGGVQPAEVNMQFTGSAFEAAAAFNANKQIAAAVSWAPDIYNLSEVQGNRMLVSTAQANKLIADVWFARADFTKDHMPIIEGLVRGIFDGMEQLKDESKKQQCAQLMADGYNIPASETAAMFADAYNTNWADNYQFFMNQNNPANFERVWKSAYYLYGRIRSITHQPVPFDQVMDYSIIEKLGKEEKFASQRTQTTIFAPRSVTEIKGAEDEILANTVIIHFYPNSADLSKKITRTIDGKEVEQAYDPNVDAVLEEIAQLAGTFGNASIIIEGHTDASMKGKAPETLVKRLSELRANAVKDALLKKFNSLDPNQFNAVGVGWDEPADPTDPENHAKNRRVEIRVFTAEAL